MTEPRPWLRFYIVKPSDARAWIGLGCYTFVWAILGMIAYDKTLLDNNAFLVLASALVLTGWNQGPVGWAYQATKGGGELADKNAEALKQRAAVDAGTDTNDMQVDAENVTVTKKGKA